MSTDTTSIDEARVEEFAERLFTTYTESFVTLMIDLAHRTGVRRGHPARRARRPVRHALRREAGIGAMNVAAR
jgi:hypothetical protein